MKVICSKENLVESINIVQKAVSNKTTQPILEGILIDASKKFKLIGNDLEIGIECTVEADIKEEGTIVINSKMFGEIVRKLPDSEVLIEVKKNNVVVIECENSLFEVKGLSAEGFPSLPEVQKENAFKIQQKILRDMIKQTIFAVGIDENRPILTGSLLECKEENMTIVSVDGFRLALRKYQVENNTSDFNVVIPGKTLNEIVKILQPVEDEVIVYYSKNQVLFDLGKCKVLSRLIEGKYLNYNSLIPKDSETKIRINRKDMLSSIERASLMTVEEKKYPIKFNVQDERLIVTSNTDAGAVREELKIDMTGNKIEVGFNPRYFIEALRVIDEEMIEIYFASSVGPCTIRPSDNEDFAYMIAVVRT